MYSLIELLYRQIYPVPPGRPWPTSRTRPRVTMCIDPNRNVHALPVGDSMVADLGHLSLCVLFLLIQLLRLLERLGSRKPV